MLPQVAAPSQSITLRYYQQEAVEATYEHIRNSETNPCIVIPTGGGKTPILSTFARDVTRHWGRRCLIVSHVRELLDQTERTLKRIDPDLPVGVYSAGMKRRECDFAATIAGVQSIYKRMFDFDPFDLIVVDECHLLPPEGEGMYRKLLADAKIVNPNVRLVGLTATPYRLDCGALCGPENLLNEICYEIGVRDLISQGFLSRLVSRCSRKRTDFSDVSISGGEFVGKSAQIKMGSILSSVVAEAIDACQKRKSCLVFAAGVENAQAIASMLRESGEEVDEIYGDTLDTFRDNAIHKFKNREIKWLVNVNVLTTGFDATNVDAIVCMRPTMSMGLWYQMVGRGLRLHSGKEDCLVLDFGGNLERHGPIDLIEPESKNKRVGDPPSQICPACNTCISIAYARCPECGHLIREPNKPFQNSKISDKPAVGPVVSNELETYQVEAVEYCTYKRKDWREGEPITMRVGYQVAWNKFIYEWICLEHAGYAHDRAVEWWESRSSYPIPKNSEMAVFACNDGQICKTIEITVDHHHKSGFDRIVKYRLGEKPELIIEEQDSLEPEGDLDPSIFEWDFGLKKI